jgi:L-alanine-DL-glutamate epimerase-like enolase superfamily enzyme
VKVSGVETLRLEEFPNLLWLRIHTDEGPVGLGETFFGARAVEAYVHETIAPYLLGQDPLRIDHHFRSLYGYVGYRSSGVEMRGNSALDIALWDLWGKATNQPVYQLLGGKSRDRIKIYNTCAGYKYVRARPEQAVDNWGLPEESAEADEGAVRGSRRLPPPGGRPGQGSARPGHHGHEDLALRPLRRSHQRPGHLGDGPRYGAGALPPDPRRGRRRDGDHGRVPLALEPADGPAHRRALEPFAPYWFEDPLKGDNIDALAAFARGTAVPTTISETLSTRWSFREAFERGAAGIAMLDLSWCGGLGEAKKIATMAEAYQLPVAPHDCTGPVVLTASTHLSINLPNALIQETVRAFYAGWYRELLTALPDISHGTIAPPPGPGLGTELKPELWERPDATVRVSGAR